MKHYIILLLLSITGFAFFSYHETAVAFTPDQASQAASDNTGRIIKTLSWLGVYLSICVGVIAHWLHCRLDKKVEKVSN